MGYDSDAIIKQMLGEIGDQGILRIRLFPEDNKSDQKHWVQGGLSFGKFDLLYGSCDAAWYVKNVWTDPLNKIKCPFKPIIAVEGTLALERGSSGSAQYQRFFHALGAVMSGVMGVYFLRESEKHVYKGKEVSSKMRYDLPIAALNAGEIHKTPYLIITNIEDLEILIKAIGSQNKDEIDKIVSSIQDKMYRYFKDNVKKEYSTIENYCKGRSIAKDANGHWIKILSSNLENLTLSAKRGGHILLGEYLIAKYFIKEPIFMLLPRLTKHDIKKLNTSKKKEWKILEKESNGRVLILDDLENLDKKLEERIRKLQDSSLKNGSSDKKLWDSAKFDLLCLIQNGKIRIKSK